MNLSLYGKLPIFFRWLECNLSIFADIVISNSEAGRKQAINDGYKNKKIIVISNGLDSLLFNKNVILREEMRIMLKIPAAAVLIGTVARHDPMKGLDIFLKAASIHSLSFPNTYFLIVGSGPSKCTELLKSIAIKLGLIERLIWVEKTNNIAPYYNAMDIFTSTSINGEGFSNAIGEAMLSQLTCVATDVGDSRKILGDCGLIVPIDSPPSVAVAWSSLLSLSEEELRNIGVMSRNHVFNNFSIDTMATLTNSALKASVQSEF
jgi:glycosyltransferase involved in cell wall biosynthesis